MTKEFLKELLTNKGARKWIWEAESVGSDSKDPEAERKFYSGSGDTYYHLYLGDTMVVFEVSSFKGYNIVKGGLATYHYGHKVKYLMKYDDIILKPYYHFHEEEPSVIDGEPMMELTLMCSIPNLDIELAVGMFTKEEGEEIMTKYEEDKQKK